MSKKKYVVYQAKNPGNHCMSLFNEKDARELVKYLNKGPRKDWVYG